MTAQSPALKLELMTEDTRIKLRRILSEYESEILYKVTAAERDKNEEELLKLRKRIEEIETIRKDLGLA